MSKPINPRIIALFDVDGTLTIPRGEITPEMMSFMRKLSEHITVGIVGGSDLPKQEEQLGEGIVHTFPFNFSQNGLVAYKYGKLLAEQTISKYLGEDNVKRLVNWVMKYLADLDLPVKRGTFIEFRSGMLNISPIGRNCSREERNVSDSSLFFVTLYGLMSLPLTHILVIHILHLYFERIMKPLI